MTYTLYYSPGSCSMAVHVLLNELGEKVDLKRTSIAEGQTRSPEFLKINPRAAVPVLVDDGQVIREGSAILTYIAEKHKSELLPASGKARVLAQEWLGFANATMHPAYGKVFFLMKNAKDGAEKDALIKAAVAQINDLWKDVDSQLAKTPYVCGESLTLADVLLTVIANWNGYLPQPVTLGDNCKRLFKTVTSRPSYQAALQAEQVEYKAAA